MLDEIGAKALRGLLTRRQIGERLDQFVPSEPFLNRTVEIYTAVIAMHALAGETILEAESRLIKGGSLGRRKTANKDFLTEFLLAGELFEREEEWDRAIETYERAIVLSERDEDEEGQIQFLDRLIAVTREIQSREKLGQALAKKGALVADYSESSALFEEAKGIYLSLGLTDKVCEIALSKARVWEKKGKPQEAELILHDLRRTTKKEINRGWYAISSYELGFLKRRQGTPNLEYFTDAAPAFSQAGDMKMALMSIGMASIISDENSDRAEADRYWRIGLEVILDQEVPMVEREATMPGLLAEGLFNQGEYEKAASMCEKAAYGFGNIGNHAQEGFFFQGQGRNLARINQKEAAKTAYENAARAYEQGGDIEKRDFILTLIAELGE